MFLQVFGHRFAAIDFPVPISKQGLALPKSNLRTRLREFFLQTHFPL
jgi:hypothetical protein